MNTIYFILYVLAVGCFFMATIRAHNPKFNLVACGLLAWVLVPMIETARML